LLLVSLSGCIDFRGAQDPDMYTPRTSHTVWRPRKEPCRLANSLQDDFEFLEEVDPISLAEALDIALINNPGTKQTWAAARVSAAEYGRSLSDDFVLADVSAQYQRMRTTFFVLGQREVLHQTIAGASLNLSYLVLDFGQVRYTSYAALESLFNADWTHNREIQNVIQMVMNDYYDYLYQKELLKARRSDVDNAQVTLDATLAALRTGMADVSDQVQATTTLKQNQLTVVQQKQNLHNAYTRFINNLGIPPNLKIAFTDYPETIETFDVESLDELILVAMQSRPDLIAAEAKVKSQENLLTASERLYLPTVSTDFSIGRNYFGQGFNDGYNFDFIASLSFPLFQGFFIKNTVKEAKADLKFAQAELDETRLNVLQDVTNYREDVILAREALVYAREFLDSAKIEFEVLLEKYKVGTTTIVDLISAQTAVADARAQLAQSERNWFSSLVNLAFGTGALTLSDSQTPDLFKAKEETLYEDG